LANLQLYDGDLQTEGALMLTAFVEADMKSFGLMKQRCTY